MEQPPRRIDYAAPATESPLPPKWQRDVAWIFVTIAAVMWAIVTTGFALGFIDRLRRHGWL